MPVRGSTSRAAPPRSAVASTLPSGEKAMSSIASATCGARATCSVEMVSQNVSSPVRLLVAISDPSGL